MRLPALSATLFLALCMPQLANAQVKRGEAIRIAEEYRNLRWTASEENAFHGKDSDGIWVDTPDEGFSRPGTRPGWWRAGGENLGMPYKWGGFSSPKEFRAGLKKGLYAGDIYSAEKRRLGDAAVSRHTVGIDCSGLISRCWKLKRPYSTRELPALCAPLPSFADLKPGDIVNAPNNHVLLFKAFTDDTKRRILAYEAGSPPTWKVLLNSIPLSLLEKDGYQPLRYRKIRE